MIETSISQFLFIVLIRLIGFNEAKPIVELHIQFRDPADEQ